MNIPRKVLVVDDSDDNRGAVGALLRFMSFEVCEVSSAEEALNKFNEFKPDVLLVDVVMPRMSGLELLERLTISSHCCQAIMMTGYECIDDACKAMEVGAYSYIRKPILYEELNEHIQKALKRVDEAEQKAADQKRLKLEILVTTNKAEAILKVAEQQSRRFDIVLNSIQEPMLAFDSEARLRIINRAAEKLFGITMEKHYGVDLHETGIEKDTVAIIKENVDRCINGEGVTTLQYVRYNGRHFSISVSTLYDELQTMCGCVSVFNDETAILEAEHLRTSFFKLVAHEFRTPLSVLTNSVALLGMIENRGDELTTIQKGMDEACNRLDRLVTTAVRFAGVTRLDANTYPEVVNVTVQIEQVVDEFRGMAANKEVTIRYVKCAGEYSFCTDWNLLKIVLTSIVDNAVKFTREKTTVVIEVVTNTNSEQRGIEITVADEGPGIPPEQTTKIFEWFQQVEDPLTRKHGGLGLGLPLALKASKLLGGSVEVKSTGELGSVFSIIIPEMLTPA